MGLRWTGMRVALAPLVMLMLLQIAGERPLGAASMTIAPQVVTLAPGGVQQFTATGTNGRIQWRATGGTISRGLYKAGTVTGSFMVQASHGGASATATVIIEAPAPPPPPSSDTSGDSGTATGSGTGVTIFPGDAVAIDPGESIQAAVNAHAEGTTFVIKAGVHRQQLIKPKNGMSFLGEPGAVLDGENVTMQAFDAYLTSNVTVRGLRITRYKPANTNGALHGDDSTGWVVEDNEIDHNSNGTYRVAGLRPGSGWTVRNNRIHHNGWNGIDGSRCADTIFEGNEIYANPPVAIGDTVGEAGNMKLFACGRIIIRGNYVHDSPHKGIWIDTMHPDVTIEGNRVINHGSTGIWYEFSYRGTVRDNYVENAGYLASRIAGWPHAAGIQISNSPDVVVTGNTVVNSFNGIIGHQAKSYAASAWAEDGTSQLRNLVVRGNTIVMPSGQTGIAHNIATNDVYTTWNNRFEGNTYQLYTAAPFYWMGSSLNETQWQSYGHDVISSGASFTR